MAAIKIKNATDGTYNFKFMHPEIRKTVVARIGPFETKQIYPDAGREGNQDVCSQIRLQAPEIPDSSEIILSDAPIQFLWDKELPTEDDYIGSLEAGHRKAAEDAAAGLESAVNAAAESLPNSESTVQVKYSGKKGKVIEASGTDKDGE